MANWSVKSEKVQWESGGSLANNGDRSPTGCWRNWTLLYGLYWLNTVHKQSLFSSSSSFKYKKQLKNTFFLKYAFISYQNKILSKLKKIIKFRGYFTHGLVLQRKIKAWSLLALGRVYLKWWALVQRRQSFGSTLLFFFVEPIQRWMTHGI